MSTTRNDLIDKYDLSDKKLNGLKNLLCDLCMKDESQSNLTLIVYALNGRYSIICNSFGKPEELLSTDLKNAGYEDLSKKVSSKRYSHTFAPALMLSNEREAVRDIKDNLEAKMSFIAEANRASEALKQEEMGSKIVKRSVFKFKK